MEVESCSCHNPNGFKFLEYKEDHQVWIHLKCGGQVIRTLIRSGGKVDSHGEDKRITTGN